MNIATSLRYGLARMLYKAAGFSIVAPWVRHSFLMPTFDRLTSEGYSKNSIVAMCITALSFTFGEPPLLVWDGEGDDAEQLPDHPLRQLLKRPNALMGEDELWQYTIAYLALGGNAYWSCPLNGAGTPVEAWPYHAGQVRPIPGGPTWIKGYEFHETNGEWEEIDPEKYLVVHFKWPLPDPSQPWLAQPPLRAVASAVDTDNECDRYLYALLKNDAIPRTIITQSPERFMTPDEVLRAKAQYQERYGSDNRGGVLIMEAGARVDRLSLNLEELAFDALRKVPEARISGAFRVPSIIAGLTSGLENSTYSNYGQARLAYTQDTLVPLWRLVASEVQSALAPAFGNGVALRHDLTNVASLQEDINAKWGRVMTAFTGGIIERNEARRALGYADAAVVEQGEADATKSAAAPPILGYHIDSGVVSRNEARAQLGLAPEDETLDDKLRRLQSVLSVAQLAVNVGLPLDITLRLVGLDPALAGPPALPALPAPVPVPEPPADEPPIDDEEKAMAPPVETKASAQRTARALVRLRHDMAAKMERDVDSFFTGLAKRVIGRAGKMREMPPSYWYDANGERKALPPAGRLLSASDFDDLEETVKRFATELLKACWPTWNDTLGVDLAFELSDPAVVAVLKDAGTRIKDIRETTLEAVRSLLVYGGEQGWGVDQLVRGDDTSPGLRSLVEETYKGRARNIARTEMGTAQNTATHARYSAAGVEKVIIFDGGGDDSDDICNQLNGTTQTLKWFQDNPLQHPSCVRCAAPDVSD